MPAYFRPTDLNEALALVAKGHRVLAGGTDIYPAVSGATLTENVVDISGLTALHGIVPGTDLRIGAMTTWTEIADASLPPALAALQQAARVIGGRQIQNAGTIGGNLCNASPAADGIPPLLAVDAQVEIATPGGIRRAPLDSWLKGPRRVDLGPQELLTAITIPASGLVGRSAFEKLGARSHLVISIAMVAVRLELKNGVITQAAAAVGACSGRALRLTSLEADLTGVEASHAQARITSHHLDTLTPIDDIRATATYRRAAVLELLRRAVERASA